MSGEISQSVTSKVLDKLPAVSQQSYLFLQKWIHRESGILIDEHKSYLLQVRLAPIVERERLVSMENLCNKLRDGAPRIAHQVIEAMTTNETFFFEINHHSKLSAITLFQSCLRSGPKVKS